MTEQMKVVLVGNTHVGKTSLLIKYTTKLHHGEYLPGIYDNSSMNMECDGHQVLLDLRDSSGDREQDRLRPLGYRDTDCFVVCYAIDDPASFEAVRDKWQPEISRYFSTSTPFILAGLRCDLRNEGPAPEVPFHYYKRRSDVLITTEQGATMAKTIGADAYVECSSLEGWGVAELFETVARATLKQRRHNKKGKCQVM
eukprot:Colp12_sorted_trinity150504_noHs@9107